MFIQVFYKFCFGLDGDCVFEELTVIYNFRHASPLLVTG